ncbi:hypothetical protein Pmar_PMAR021398 [Perkinsus marinus ATCC 50983]|uniref:Tr-type G domain-containing protein n=1 Tax=Perkinsus marinus (strain ATCC 50983 / TXsc) TaxID=423536 RepID=C5KX62_PERM5|nr:hypothetical protein Pmar_PMAR021398 [Perkinsus marinus ATCC 50983]EER10918.1 hypothetical protein Pmar_PMAR021398 [Perkinsus marinus ATCC 50983]|eukprot:XP_002779123.1 hypothetical protein Pmar_PMAR021398 [Perkinsus marinus ATCC 50983]
MTGIETRGAQYLDTLEVERERGITIKAQSCSILYDNPKDGLTYLLNLIDTPGHTDFQYEVARSLSACQGAILLVDALQGVQAQTVANFYLAFMQQGLEVIGALNKIDIEHVDLSSSRAQLASLMDTDESAILGVSAKTGKNVDKLLEAIIDRIPPPQPDASPCAQQAKAPLRALLLDMWFDRNRGAVLLVYLTNGSLKKGEMLELKHAGRKMTASDVGVMHPNLTPLDSLHRGQLGYITCNRNQDIRGLRVGDTISRVGDTVDVFPGFQPARSMVRRGVQLSYELIDPTRAMFKFELPLSEIIVDFADKILQLSHGYASFVYEHRGTRDTDLRKVEIKINGDPAEALSFICRHDAIREVAGKMLRKLKEHISPHAFEINLQGCVGGKVLVSEKIGKQKKSAIAKDHSVAGDPTRKMKLIKEAKEREKKLKQIGRIKVPPEAFMQIVRLD